MGCIHTFSVGKIRNQNILRKQNKNKWILTNICQLLRKVIHLGGHLGRKSAILDGSQPCWQPSWIHLGQKSSIMDRSHPTCMEASHLGRLLVPPALDLKVGLKNVSGFEIQYSPARTIRIFESLFPPVSLQFRIKQGLNYAASL